MKKHRDRRLDGELQYLIERGTLSDGTHVAPAFVSLVRRLRRWPGPDEYPADFRDWLGTLFAREAFYARRLIQSDDPDHVTDYLVAERGLTLRQVERLTLTERVRLLRDGLSAGQAGEAGSVGSPPDTEGAAPHPVAEVNPFSRLSPPGKALAAAYDLKREGLRVTVKAAAERAGVNRSHLTTRYPEAVRLIKALGTPDGRPPRGSKDRHTGRIEAADDDEG